MMSSDGDVVASQAIAEKLFSVCRMVSQGDEIGCKNAEK